MSYRNPYHLGAAPAFALLPAASINMIKSVQQGALLKGASGGSVIQPDSPGLRMAPQSVQDAVTIQVPASCGNLNALVEGIQVPATGLYLTQGKLYVIAWPLNKRLDAQQQAAVNQEFMNLMNPAAIKYPVKTTTPCDLGARKSDACFCRDRKNRLTYLLHKPSNVHDSIEVQKCRSTAERKRARAYISLFHQLWPSHELPFGYREISGNPAFVYTISLNPDPKINLLNDDGSVRSGNVQAKPPQLPQVPRQKVYALAFNSLRNAMQAAGFRKTDVAPSAMLTIDKYDATPLKADIDALRETMGRAARETGNGTTTYKDVPTSEAIGSSLRWNWARYDEGKRNNASPTDKMYTKVVNEAIEQAAAYGRDSVMAIWGSLAGLFVYGFSTQLTDSFARQSRDETERAIEGFGHGIAAIQSSQTVIDNVKAMAPRLLESPDPQASYQVVKELKAAFNQSIGIIQGSQVALSRAPQTVAKLFDRVKRVGGEIEKGLEEAKVKLQQRAPGLDSELKRRFNCKLYAKTRNEQQVWPRRLLDQLPPLQGAIQAYASLNPQAGAAIGRYQEAIALVDEIESQLDLPWWAKDLGPLPVWGWSAIGLTAFVGGAVYIRKKRKKRVKPNRSMKDMATVAFQIARAQNYNDQGVARALRAEFGDDAANAAKFAHVAAEGGAEANFWRDVQMLLKLGYNRSRKRRRRTSRAA